MAEVSLLHWCLGTAHSGSLFALTPSQHDGRDVIELLLARQPGVFGSHHLAQSFSKFTCL